MYIESRDTKMTAHTQGRMRPIKIQSFYFRPFDKVDIEIHFTRDEKMIVYFKDHPLSESDIVIFDISDTLKRYFPDEKTTHSLKENRQ